MIARGDRGHRRRYGIEVRLKQFRLGTLFLLILCLALACGYGSLLFRYRVVRSELEMLRKEQGFLTVVDPTAVAIVEVPTNELDVWRFRVFVPTGTRVDLGIQTHNIPASGAPEPSVKGVFLKSSPNGTLVTASIKKSIKDGYDLILDLGDGSRSNVREDKDLNLWHDGGCEWTVAGRGGTKAVKLGETIILVKKRLMEQVSPTSSRVPAGFSRGYMFWIRPHKEP